MKKLLLLTCLTIFFSCVNQKNSKELGLSFEDDAIEVLQLYQNVDSQILAKLNETYQSLLKQSEPYSEASEEDKNFFLRNVANIDSVVCYGVSLVRENRVSDLLALLEAELPNFHAHPHNCVSNEVRLHRLLIELYNLTLESHEEYINKIIYLHDLSIVHIETLKDKHPHYSSLLLEQVYSCIEIGLYNKAILNGEKLSAYTIQLEDEEGQIFSSLLLAKAYEKAELIELKDSTINSVKLLPRYSECCEIFENLFIAKK